MKLSIFNDPEIRGVEAAGKSKANVVLVSGENVVTINDVTDAVMGVNISHVYRKGLADKGKGEGFRLNLNERFSQDENGYFYDYVNDMGDETKLRTYYYYLDSVGDKEYVYDLTNVISDSSGRFFYGSKQLKTEVKNAKGLKTVEFTPNQQIKYSYLIDKRTDEIKQLESEVERCEEVFSNYVLFDVTNGVARDIEKVLNDSGEQVTLSAVEALINSLEDDNPSSVILKREEANKYEAEYAKYEAWITKQGDLASIMQNAKTALIEELTSKKNEFSKVFKDSFIAYYNTKRKLGEEKAKTPVSYVLDGEKYKGYNYNGDLVCVFNKFGNSTVIEYGLTKVNGVDNYTRIDRIYNSDNKQIIFEYVEDMVDGKQVSRLKRITTSTGKSVSYKYI